MRKFLTCALCFVPTLAGAITLYYDKSGECDGWWLGTVQTGCPASNLRVTKFHPTTAESKVFGGIVIGGETVVESDGTLKSFNSLSENTKSAIRAATSLDVYKQEWNVDDTVTVNFDARGGKMSGATSRQMARGTALPTISGPRGDGASFGGWTKGTSTTKVTTVDQNATNGDTYTANWECGTGLSPNRNGVCVPSKGNPNGDTYIDDDGNEHDIDEIDCGYLNGTGTGNENFCNRTVVVHLHDKPTNSSLNVTNGNDGRTLWCNRVWCYEPYWAQVDGQNGPNANAGALVETINMPHANGYAFRGYFYPGGGKGHENELVTNLARLVIDDTHNQRPQDVAAGQFYPKNTSETVSWMGIYNPTHGINIWYDPDDGSTSIQGLPFVTSGPLVGMHEIDLYGGWARACDAGNNATCTLEKGTRIPSSNGLYPGQVRYDVGCENGYHVTGGAGTYSPTCSVDEGDINMSYAFTNQYGDVVSCASPVTDTCKSGNNVSLLNTSNFKTSCGTRYALRWLKVNGTWYSPNKSVSCTSNILGAGNPVNVTGYVCDVCQPTTHGTCENISRDTVINFDPHGAGTYNGNLWGENGGTVNPTPACQVMKCGADNSGYTYLWKNPMTGIRSCEKPCSDGYAAYPDETTGNMKCLSPYDQCMVACQQDPSKCGNNPATYCQTSTFECPQPNLNLADGMTIGNGILGRDNTCTYTLGCSGSGAVLIKNGFGMGTSPQTIECSGDACGVTANLQNQLAGYSCFTCPAYSGSSGALSVSSVSTITPENHNGVLTCNYNVSCRTGNHAGELAGVATCTSDSNQSTQCYVPMGTSYIYTNLAASINALEDNCTGATQTFACPTGFTVPGITITPDSGNATATSSCSYTLSCPNETDILVSDTEKEPDESGGTATVQCTGMSGNNSCSAESLSDKFSHYSCQSPEE